MKYIIVRQPLGQFQILPDESEEVDVTQFPTFTVVKTESLHEAAKKIFERYSETYPHGSVLMCEDATNELVRN